MDNNGLVYLLNLAGQALEAANAEINHLRAELEKAQASEQK